MIYNVLIQNNDYVAIPGKMIDYFIKLANEEQLKVLLFIARHQASDLSLQQIANGTSLSEDRVTNAIAFLKNINIISETTDTNGAVFSPAPDISSDNYATSITSEEYIETIRKKFSLRCKFSAKEKELVKGWYSNGISMDLAIYAYAEAMLRIERANISYIDKILSSWIADSKRTVEDVASSETDTKKAQKAEIVSKCSEL